VTDWKLLAAAHGLELGPEEAERVRAVMEALERAFRPLAASIPPEVEPAVIFSCPPEEKP
jgi:hypothetical protein